jgi:Flp pilus assembly protein TadG
MNACRPHRSARGQIVPMAALMMVALIAFVALVIDGGRGYLDRRTLQSTADTSALSGAGQLEQSGRSRYDFSYARAAAINEAVSNLPGTQVPSGYSFQLNAGTGSPGTCTNPLQCDISGLSLGNGYTVDVQATLTTVTATLHHSMSLTFGVAAGFGPSITPSASATAENGGLGFALILFRNNSNGSNSYGNLEASGSGVTLDIRSTSAGTTGDAMTNEGICPAPGVVDFANNGDQYAYVPTWSKFPGSSCGSVGTNVTNMAGSPSSLIQEPQIADPDYPEPTPGDCTGPYGVTGLCGQDVSVSTSGYYCLAPGTYSSIEVKKGTLVLLPGKAYKIDDSTGSNTGFRVDNTGSSPGKVTSLDTTNSAMYTACGYSSSNLPTDTGVAIDMVPVNGGGTATGSSNQLYVSSGASLSIKASPVNHYVSIYVEKNSSGDPCSWTTSGCGSNVVVFSGGAFYSVGGVVYGYSDNMSFGGGSGGQGIGQVFAWTMTINGNGSITETYDPGQRPVLQGLIK